MPESARRYIGKKNIRRKPPGEFTRGNSSERGYNARWQRARLAHLDGFPLCANCERLGRVTEATVVDHKRPHRGNQTLFWDSSNWESLCVTCHGSKTGKGA